MNKKLFTGLFILLILFQVIIDLCHSVTFFPFVHYGMFSESFHKPDSTELYEVTINGKVLHAADFRIYTWDMIHVPLTTVTKQLSTQDFAFDKQKLREGMQTLGLKGCYAALEPNLTNDPNLTNRWPQWYKAYLSRLIGYPVQSLQVDKLYYSYRSGEYSLLRRQNWINL